MTTAADPTQAPISDGKITMGNTNCCYSKFARPSDQREEKKKRRKHKEKNGGSNAKVTTNLEFVEWG